MFNYKFFNCLKYELILKNYWFLLQVVYTGAVLSGEYTYWQYCWDKYTSLQGTPEGATERMQLLRALGKTKDAWLVYFCALQSYFNFLQHLLSNIIDIRPFMTRIKSY